MKNRITFLVAMAGLLACLFMQSCKDKQDTYNAAFNYEYFPLDSGHYVTYDVDSIFSYSSNFEKDTAHYQLREMITDTFYDNQGDLNYMVDIYRRENANGAWVFDRRWSAKRTVYNAQKNEDDLRFIKLIFPPQLGTTWNGNIYLPISSDPYRPFENWDYHYESVDAPYSINGFNFDSSLTVINVADSIFTYKHVRKEVYAKNVGLVYQEWEMKTKQKNGAWDTVPWNGFSLHMRVVDHN